MTSLLHNRKDAPHNRAEPNKNILRSGIYRNLFFYVLKGISMYADRSRKLGAKNERVDRFTAFALSHFISNNPLDLKDLIRLLDEALTSRDLARKVYRDTCERLNKTPEVLTGPATLELFTDEVTIGAQARGLSARKLSDEKHRQDIYWEGVCIERLATLGAIVVSAPTEVLEKEKYDICEVLHDNLNTLSQDLSTFALMALADEIEKEQLKVVNAVIAGDTLVNIPPKNRVEKPSMA